MVVHVGIDVKERIFSTYSSLTEITQRFKLSNYVENVDDMFEEIKTKIGEEEKLGCCCVCLKSKHNNEVRRKIIESGKRNGFAKIQIIDKFSALIMECIKWADCKINMNDVVWFLSDHCYIFKKTEAGLKLIKYFEDVEEELAEMKLKSEIEEEPRVVFNFSDSGIVKTVFPKAQIFYTESYFYMFCASPLNIKLETNDIIWILNDDTCDIWKKTENNSEFIQSLEDVNASTEEGMEEIKWKAEMQEDPTVIINLEEYEIFKNSSATFQIFDHHTVLYYGIISQMNCKFETNDVIWFLYDDTCDIWKKTETTTTFIKSVEDVNASTEEGLCKIKLKSEMKKDPKVIINLEDYEISDNTSSTVLRFFFDRSHTKGTLITAKTCKDNFFSVNNNVEPMLNIPIDIKLNGKIFYSINGLLSLPFNKTVPEIIIKVKKIQLINATKYRLMETFYSKFKNVFLKLEYNRNGISTVKFVPYFTVTIFDNIVLLCNNKTNEIQKFPASVDYGSDPYEFAVDCKSPTVIEYQSGNNFVKTKTVLDLNETKHYYILNLSNGELHIEETKFFVDVFQGIFKIITSEHSAEISVVFTIPFHFNEEKKGRWRNAISIAGFKNYETQKEENALCDGFEKQYNIFDESKYIMVHVMNRNSIIMLREAPNICLESTVFDTSVLIKYKDSGFDKSYDTEDKQTIKSQTKMTFEYIEEILKNNDDLAIVVTGHRLLYTLIKDRFPDVASIIFIEEPGELIVKNGIFGYGSDNNEDDSSDSDSSDSSSDDSDDDDDDSDDNSDDKKSRDKNSQQTFECKICCETFKERDGCIACEKNPFATTVSNNTHSICIDCMRGYAHSAITEAQVAHGGLGLKCVEYECKNIFLSTSFEFYLNDEDYLPLKLRLQEQCLADTTIEDLVMCTDCGLRVCAHPFSIFFICECGRRQCRFCPRLYDDLHEEKTCEEINENESKDERNIESKMSEAIIRKCHKCGIAFVKKDGCNKMTCQCGANQCYVCHQKNIKYTHFCSCGDVQRPHGECETCKKTCRLWENTEELDELKINEVQQNTNTPTNNPDIINKPLFNFRFFNRFFRRN